MILVTGSTGFLGRHAFRALWDAGHPAKGLVRDGSRFCELFPRAPKPIEADLGSLKRSDLAEARFKALVHLAAAVWPVDRGDVARFAKTNFEGTKRLLDAIDPKPIDRIVLASTIAVYGPLAGTITEEHPLRPAGPYAASKVEQENVVAAFARAHKLSLAILRFPSIYGPGQDGSTVLPKFLALARAGKRIEITGPRGRRQNFLHVDDAAAAVVAAIESDAEGAFNVAAPREVSMAELAKIVISVTASHSPVVRREDDVEAAPFRIDTTRASAELDLPAPRDLEQGLRTV